MVGLRRIARCRTNTLIFLVNQRVIGQLFIGCITPKLGSDTLVHALGKGLSKSVRQCFRHDGAIIIARFFKAFGDIVFAMTGGHGKTANIVGTFGNKISQRIIGAFFIRPIRTQHLLAQCVQAGALFSSCIIIVNDNIITITRRRPKADDRFGSQPFFVNHLVEHGLCVFEQIGRRIADNVIGQNRRIAAMQIPALEERRPVNIIAQFSQIIIVKNFRAGKLRFDRLIILFRLKGILARIGNRHALILGASACMCFCHRHIISANIRLIIIAFFVRQ